MAHSADAKFVPREKKMYKNHTRVRKAQASRGQGNPERILCFVVVSDNFKEAQGIYVTPFRQDFHSNVAVAAIEQFNKLRGVHAGHSRRKTLALDHAGHNRTLALRLIMVCTIMHGSWNWRSHVVGLQLWRLNGGGLHRDPAWQMACEAECGVRVHAFSRRVWNLCLPPTQKKGAQNL